MSEASWQCKTCGESFSSLNNYLFHLEYIEKKKYVKKCDHCLEVFTGKVEYKYHLQSTHNIQMNCPQCNICGAVFRTSYFVERHMTVHFPDKGFPCSKCGRKFTQKYNKNIHEQLCTAK